MNIFRSVFGPRLGDYEQIRSQYKAARSITFKLHNGPLLKSVPIADHLVAAADLGMLELPNTVAFESEEDVAVLMDYILYGLQNGGETAIQRYLRQAGTKLDEASRSVLNAMAAAKYGFIKVTAVIPGIGVQVDDEWRDRNFLLADIGFSATARIGMSLIGNYLRFPNFGMTTGAMLPLIGSTQRVIRETARCKLQAAGVPSLDSLPSPALQKFKMTMIKIALNARSSESIVYVDTPGTISQSKRRGPKNPRNSKKYKKRGRR